MADKMLRVNNLKWNKFLGSRIVTIFFFLLFLLQGCNYHYYQGKKLEKLERFEEANIEYHRAYIDDPEDEDFSDAYYRTAKFTVKDLLERYYRYIKDNNFLMAFSRLEHAQTLYPENLEIQTELKKWVRVLLAGKVSVDSALTKQDLPLADEMNLVIRINTPNPENRLKAYINIQTGIFSVEDILYNPPQELIMFYSLNSIGIELKYNRSELQIFGSEDFKNFISVGNPVLVEVKGNLAPNRPVNQISNQVIRVEQYFPVETFEKNFSKNFHHSEHGIRYYVKLDQNKIGVKSTTDYIDFLPQVLYINSLNQRFFLDFGHIQLFRKNIESRWSFKRILDKNRRYFQDLKKNIILDPYFYAYEGGYPFVREEL